MHKILLLNAVPEPLLREIDEITATTPIDVYPAWDDTEAARAHLTEATIIYGHPRKELVAEAHALRWLHWTSAGVNMILPHLPENITLTKSQGVYGIPIAEHVMAMMLALARRLPETLVGALEHKHESGRYRELHGATAGILGFGGIGEVLAPRLRALGMRVLGLRRSHKPHDPTPADLDEIMGPDRLGDLLAASDHLVSILPDTPEAARTLDGPALRQMKRGATLYNVGRGSTVDHDALVEVLRSGHLRGAGLDVTDPEPLPDDHPLRTMSNVIITPHNAGSSPHNEYRLAERFVTNLRRYLNGEPLIGMADRDAAY